MSFAERKAVVDLSHALLEEGLVVRTWGNISHRTTGGSFVITPSGRNYTTMIEADLAQVSVEGDKVVDKSGPFKPSSEYPMHALCYRLRPDANAVVHTHQRYASALSLMGTTVELTDREAELIGQRNIPIASYGLPGTGKLHKNVEQVLQEFPEANVLLLEAHGVFLCGDTPDHALELAQNVEIAARRVYQETTGSNLSRHFPAEHDVTRSELVQHEHSAGSTPTVRYFHGDQDITAAVGYDVRRAHETAYAGRKKARAIRVSRDGEVAQFTSRTLKPYLDDFAQIVGRQADATPRSNVVFTKDGALCLGKDDDDARAVQSVLEKNARAACIAESSGREPINDWECRLMNAVYQLKYSKQAG